MKKYCVLFLLSLICSVNAQLGVDLGGRNLSNFTASAFTTNTPTAGQIAKYNPTADRWYAADDSGEAGGIDAETATNIAVTVSALASSVPYAIPYAASVTVDPANGWNQYLDCTNDCTITFASGSAASDTLLMVTLMARESSITLGTNNVFGTNHTAMVWPAPPPTNQPLIISMQNPLFTTNWTATWHIGSLP